MITLDELSALPRVRHGFLTRRDPDGDARLGLSTLVTVKQKHTADARIVEAPWPRGEAPVADALVTAAPGIALGVVTADCAPVLLADAGKGVVAAAHAGWRGALDGVLENTVAAMRTLGADPAHMVAAVGPCIAQKSYEVGPEFIARFTEADAANARYFTAPKPSGHAHFDLPAYVRGRLVRAGVTRVVIQGADCCAEDGMFFSHRRAVLRKEDNEGRQLSAIGLAME